MCVKRSGPSLSVGIGVASGSVRKGRESNHAGPCSRRRTEWSRRCSATELPFHRVIANTVTEPSVAGRIVMRRFRSAIRPPRGTRRLRTVSGAGRHSGSSRQTISPAIRSPVPSFPSVSSGTSGAPVFSTSAYCVMVDSHRVGGTPSSSFVVISIARLSVSR